MKTLLFLVALALAPGAAINASEPTVVTVAVEANWPPMEFIDESGNVAGFSIDYINAVSREAGFVARHVAVPWETIFEGLFRGDYDMVASSVSITPEREAVMDFSVPYYDVRQAVVAPSDSAIRRRGDLAGKKLGVQLGTTGHFAAQRIDQAEVVSFEAIGQALEALQKGELDCVVADDPVATSFILNNAPGAPKMKVALILPSDNPEYYGFAVNKGNARLLELLDRGIMKVQEKGIDGDLRRKWIGF